MSILEFEAGTGMSALEMRLYRERTAAIQSIADQLERFVNSIVIEDDGLDRFLAKDGPKEEE